MTNELARLCPYCGARPGKICRSVGGHYVNGRTHVTRNQKESKRHIRRRQSTTAPRVAGCLLVAVVPDAELRRLVNSYA